MAGWFILVAALLAGPVTTEADAAETSMQGPQSAPAPTIEGLLNAANELRQWGVDILAASSREPLAGSLDGLLADCLSHAAAAVPTVWIEAAPGEALREAFIAANSGERRRLVSAGLELVELAPSIDLERRLLRVTCRMAESLASAAPACGEGGGIAIRPKQPAANLVERLHGRLRSLSASPHPRFVERSLSRVEALSLGSAIPRFVARDTAGNEVRSSDFIGKITLYRAWDASSPASIEAHRLDAQLLRRHWDLPFDLVGMSDDPDRAAHLAMLPALGFGGTQLYDGPIGIALVDALAKAGASSTDGPVSALGAWSSPSPGTCILVDSRGVVRGRDLSHAELDALIHKLVAEHRIDLRKRRAAR